MTAGFSGEVAYLYARYRRGYAPVVIDWLADALALDSHGVVLDLGCGTGQLTIPPAPRAHAVVGMDPEPDMLARAQAAAADQGCRNIAWMLGSDRELPVIATLADQRDATLAAAKRGVALLARLPGAVARGEAGLRVRH